jgi:hypothetical protein
VAEADALRAAGIAVVANVEESAGTYRGTAAGIRWATAGDAFFRKLGMPADRPIYFSVDWDAGPADWPDIDAALRGSASVLGPGRVGVYGSYATVAHCAAAGTAAWFWQTYAWSGGRWHPAAHLQQYRNNVALAGGTVDLTRAVTTDYGQWGEAGMTIAPAALLAARKFYIDTLKTAGYTIDPLSVGIVGDDNHAQTGNSYHLGRSALIPTSYTIVESSRDKNGLSEAAAALDLGYFKVSVGGKSHDLRSFSLWLVAQCKAGTSDTADIREVIYSPDGTVVKRWDRLGKRTTGDSSHLTHTHESWFRDSETRDKTAHLRRYFTEIGVLEDDDMALSTDMITLTPQTAAAIGKLAGDKVSAAILLQTAVIHGARSAAVAQAAADKVIGAVQALGSSGAVDPKAIAAAVAGILAPQIDAAVAKLSEIVTDPVSPEEGKAILLDALAEAFGRPSGTDG